jgi:hypothetical protein
MDHLHVVQAKIKFIFIPLKKNQQIIFTSDKLISITRSYRAPLSAVNKTSLYSLARLAISNHRKKH